MKLSFMKWFPSDWLRDTGRLSPEARGIWIDIICLAWNEPERGVYKRQKDEFCRELRLDPGRLIDICTDLASVATVTIRDKEVTVICRRTVREEKAYKDHANRQSRYVKRHKNDASLTYKMLDVRRYKRLTSNISPSLSPPKGGADVRPRKAIDPTLRATGQGQAQELGIDYEAMETAEQNRTWKKDPEAGNGFVRDMTNEEMEAIKRKNMKDRGDW